MAETDQRGDEAGEAVGSQSQVINDEDATRKLQHQELCEGMVSV